ncbi:response regulator [Pseudanabaena sp. FACHB-2040]|uniref:response regulator n=1 Tax=Pseudanabaena sp. FACHB-2040 TaxID=2692859 RepID=UPI001687D034|nr:response regulator [Pseudanabaena sp. FACHB-2040]MBD2256095.1 response regulator [Pseudanabaena sp. FACHB-2040]
MRILLVEDDEHVAELLKTVLTEHRYVVDTAADGQAGWELVEEISYDLVLLDVMLPKLDGVSFCRQLRAKGNPVPILLLTARSTNTDKVMGLDAGADDYLIKPVEPTELTARIRALLRRGQVTSTLVLTWGNLKLDPSNCGVTYGDVPLRLTPKEYALLELFLRNSNRVYSRSAILDQLWSFDEFPEEDTIKSHIKGLRQKLKTVGAPDLIETVYGLGYRLNQTYLKDEIKPQASSTLLANVSQMQQTRETVAKIWQRAQGKILDRVELLDQAIAILQTNPLEKDTRQEARQEAHKLVGSLGTFGIAEGSQLARKIESLCQPEVQLKQPQLKSLQRLIKALRQLVEGATQQPLEQPDSSNAELEAKHQGEKKAGRQPSVLIVGASREWADLLQPDVAAGEIRISTAADVAAARVAIRCDRPDIVLLDLPLANVSESEQSLLNELASYTPPLPVLVCSEQDQFSDRISISRLRGRGFLQKPATATQVLDAIDHILQQTEASKGRVLIVDDDPSILEMLRVTLEPWGFEVITLDHPLQLWDCLETVPPDLLVLDIEMPEVSGIELCQTLRNDSRWGWLPILFLTSKTDPDTVHQVFAAGADDYISKPIVATELVTRILNRLERTRMLRRLSKTDPLTGITNRQQSTEDLNRLLLLAKRSQQPVCLAMLKPDDLKQINHQYGQVIGDQVLYQIGQLLRQKFRSEDVVARWSGVEFAIGLYGMTRSEGVEGLADVLETLRLKEFTASSGKRFQVTFSAGVTQYPEDGTGLNLLYQAAMAALADAKKAGGDRVLPFGWQPIQPQSLLNIDVVLVHPDSTFAKATLRALETRGYHCHWLQDGKTMIETLGGAAPSLSSHVILLGAFPGLNRLELVKRLKRNKVTRSSRVILLEVQSNEAEKALEIGAFDYTVAPFSFSVLMQQLRRASKL